MSQRTRQEGTEITTTLQRDLPIPHDRRFHQFLAVLDSRSFDGVRGEGASPEIARDSRPRRVLPLAVLAVVLVTLLASGAAKITWEMSGERYVEEIVGPHA